jgi:hypothetical protein
MQIKPGKLFFFMQRFLASMSLKVEWGPSHSKVREVAQLFTPQPTPKPLIRVGGASDGAYLIPDDLEGVGALFSPGVAESSSFEFELANLGIHCYLADFSVNSPTVSHPLFEFDKLWIGTETNNEVSITLADWVDQKSPQNTDLILQMDIEGAEWSVLESIPLETLRRFRIIVIELHYLDAMMTNNLGIKRVEAIFRKMNSEFVPVHIHANNCCGTFRYLGLEIPAVIELTLLRKDRFSKATNRHPVQIPNPLDIKNVQNGKEILLSSDWTGK